VTRHASWGALLLVTAVAVSALAAPREARAAAQDDLRAKIETLVGRERECESRGTTIGQQRVSAATASYPSSSAQLAAWEQLDRALAAERRCTVSAGDEIVQALAALEVECQKVDSDAARQCAQRARDERVVRKQIQGLRAHQYTCEQEAMKTDASIRRRPASSPTDGTGRAARDQAEDLRLLERRRDDSVACARNAWTQQEDLKRALASRGVRDPGAADTLAQQYERDTRALGDLLRSTLQELEPGTTPRYEIFAHDMEGLQKGLAVYRSRHKALIADDRAVRARKLLEAADLLVSTTAMWRAELQARREATGVRTEIEAGSRPDASVSARLGLAENRRALEAFILTEQAALRQRAEAWQRARTLMQEAMAASE
jgi:hypothetical protein